MGCLTSPDDDSGDEDARIWYPAADEYSRLGKSTIIESFQHFIKAIPQIYDVTYLRSPMKDDLTKLLHNANQRGFPGMLSSLDCMHWQWKNCPTAF